MQGRINEKIVVQADIQSRLNDDASRLGVIQISPSVGYKFSENVTSVAGYMFAHTDPADRPAKDEHRLYAQVAYPLAEIGKVRLTARTRIKGA